MLMNYLRIGITHLIISIPIAVICILIYYAINFLIVKKINSTVFKFICQVAWIAIIISILGITGVFNGDYNVASILNGNVQYSFIMFEQGITIATILNIILFIPYGFLSATLFKKIRKKMIYGILIGLMFSVGIEFFQSFTGRFVELEDILMNTFGTYIGYTLCIVLVKCRDKKARKDLKIQTRNTPNI